jgi:hypothetical protein
MSGSANLDLRLPIGVLFLLFGGVMTAVAAVARKS